MGWNTTVVFAEHATAETLSGVLPDVFTVTDELLGWEEASSARLAPNLAFGRYEGWLIVYDPNAKVAFNQDIITKLSRGPKLWSPAPTAWPRLTVLPTQSKAGCCGRSGVRMTRLSEESGQPLAEEKTSSGTTQRTLCSSWRGA